MKGLPVSRFSTSIEAVEIVQFSWTIQTETDAEVFGCEESAPLFIEQDAVCLHPIKYALVMGSVLPLERNNSFEIFQSQQGWFASVP
jgi:hypothetical protein